RPPQAGEGRDGGGVGRGVVRRRGRTLPPPQPSPADGGRGPRAWRRLGSPAPSPACGGRPGWGRCRTRGFAAQRSDFAPTPTLPRGRGRGGHGRGGGWAALLLHPHAGEGRDGGPRPTRGSATKQQHLAASAFHLATTPAVRR